MTVPTNFEMVCYGCGGKTVLEHPTTCPACGEPLALKSTAVVGRDVFTNPPRSMWSYGALLPIVKPHNIVSLHEGATPLIRAERLGKTLGFGELTFKNEMANPTGSFKDRQVSVGISHARELGAQTVAVVSSGNVACATSAYAARAGMTAVLMMHGHAAPGKIVQASAYGGRVVQVQTPSAGAVFDLCLEACREFGWYHLSTAGMYEAYNVEGTKTIAYELFHQTNGDLPDWIVAPVGGGGLLGGIWRGLLDLQRLGLIERLPRLAGIQASGCAPLTKAIANNTPFLETLKEPWPNPQTIAGGIADDVIFDGHTVLPAIRTTHGVAIDVDDDAIVAGQQRLAEQEGLLCEPTCAVVIAALERLPEITPMTRVCCMLTGTGIKDLQALAARVGQPAKIAPSLEALRAEVVS